MSASDQADSPSPQVPVGERLKRLLRVVYRARRAVLLEDHTGIGKSEIIKQVAQELGIGWAVLDLSLIEPPDLVGLPVKSDGRTTYAVPEILPRKGAGILMLEELNRAERYIQQTALQLLTEGQLHEYKLPAGWVVWAAINPEQGDYQVTPLDRALRSRFLNVRVRANRREWVAWAEQNGVHPVVLTLARSHDRIFDETPPRTWTYVSDTLHVLEPEEREDTTLVRDLLGGYLPLAWVELVVEALKEQPAAETGIDADRLLREYHTAEPLQTALRGLADEGRTDRLDDVAHRIASIVEGPELGALVAREDFKLAAFEGLLGDLPGDSREALQEAFGQNPVSARLLDVTPQEILNGYQGSRAAGDVDTWLQDPCQRHRVLSLVTALCQYLEGVSSDKVHELRKKPGPRVGLGQFIAQIGERMAAPLREALRRRGIAPILPERAQRRAR